MALYAAFTFLILPKGKAQQAAAPLPAAQLLLLTVAVLVVSAGSRRTAPDQPGGHRAFAGADGG